MGGGIIFVPDSGDRIHVRTYHKLCSVCCSLISVHMCARLETAAKAILRSYAIWLAHQRESMAVPQLRICYSRATVQYPNSAWLNSPFDRMRTGGTAKHVDLKQLRVSGTLSFFQAHHANGQSKCQYGLGLSAQPSALLLPAVWPSQRVWTGAPLCQLDHIQHISHTIQRRLGPAPQMIRNSNTVNLLSSWSN